MTWKAAIANACRVRARRHIIASIFVSSVCGIATTILNGPGKGLVTWALLAVAMFVIYVGDDARLQRKQARKEASRVSP